MPHDRIRWGIVGTGKIADSFAEGLRAAPEAELVALGSRSKKTAEAFGARHSISHRHGSYAALAEDPEVDVAYIATPHTLHFQNASLCLEAGKSVLCEKPFTLNAGEAQALIRLARERKLFLMEAMWTRFLPAMGQVSHLLQEGALGEVRLLAADFGKRFEVDPDSRLFAARLGGGALLDLGVYPVSLASCVFGPPARISSLAQLGQTGVDEQEGILLAYEGGRLAILYASMQVTTPDEATILGTRGYLRIHSPMHAPDRLTLFLSGMDEETLEFPIEGNGLHYQTVEVMRCLREGMLESERMPLDESLQVMQTMDALRSQWGLKYPTEA
ncbi:MAG: Gfo/Idh/MocA family oxidoreductase [Anaerolineales bacterium]|nr:Gfo/Idh/MocA family oxidoreductase [Anaerolineales bacterium]